ncbi:MAG: replication initiator protein A [Lachnospiraceae bacterium]|nr:replication initiator protein A [Lachnospiraceae bacterium]
MYDYYYGPESEQFAFYRIPKVLFEAESVRDISTDAKLLYGLMLDRMQLSAKNGWLDPNGRVYIYYTVKQIMKAMSCSNKTVTRLLNELEGVHLISREKSGFSKPDRIYVMNFLAVVYKVHHETCKKYTTGDVESTPREMYNLHPNDTDINNTEYSDTESIVSISKNGCDAMDEYNAYESLIKENIEFDCLVSDHPYERDALQEIVSIMTDVMMTKSGTIRISGDDKPVDIVKSRFIKLNSEHISYVLQGLKDNPVKVRNIKAYLLASLYNAPTTISNYYSALVNHDMANGLI